LLSVPGAFFVRRFIPCSMSSDIALAGVITAAALVNRATMA
jgi:hypothetical protein